MRTLKRVGLCHLVEKSVPQDGTHHPVYEVVLEGEGVMHRSSNLSDATAYFHMLLGEEDKLPSDND
ncbi:hypothetical protein QQM79_07050 [Marinobacteraceae bacterium S3BR75-40.1]